MSEKTIYGEAVEKWGVQDRLLMVGEELGELITVLNHWRRGRVKVERVVEEVADCIIVIEQIPHILAKDGGTNVVDFMSACDRARDRKLRRLRRLIEGVDA